MTKDEAMKLALEALGNSWTEPGNKQYEIEKEAITALREALAEQPAQQEPWCMKMNGCKTKCEDCPVEVLPAQQEPVALKWQQAPIRTAWGDDMVVASVAIDKDHTLCLYCERDQTPKVDAVFAQRTWVGLTDEEIEQGCKESWVTEQAWQSAVWWAEAKLKEKNT